MSADGNCVDVADLAYVHIVEGIGTDNWLSDDRTGFHHRVAVSCKCCWTRCLALLVVDVLVSVDVSLSLILSCVWRTCKIFVKLANVIYWLFGSNDGCWCLTWAVVDRRFGCVGGRCVCCGCFERAC